MKWLFIQQIINFFEIQNIGSKNIHICNPKYFSKKGCIGQSYAGMTFDQLFTQPDFEAKNLTLVNCVICDVVHSQLNSENPYIYQ